MSWAHVVIVVVPILIVAMAVSYRLSPAIGETRVIQGAALPVLWPGEMASAQFDRESVMRAFARGAGELEPSGWLVEPMPGALGWWIRARYRVFWWWVNRYLVSRPPRLDVTVDGRRAVPVVPRETSQTRSQT